MLAKTATVFTVVGLVLFSYGGLSYLKISRELQKLKEEDLVAYYLDLFYNLLPRPFWSAVAGLILMLMGFVTGIAAFCFEK